MANLIENASAYAGGVTRVTVARYPTDSPDGRPGPSGSSSRTMGRESRQPTVTHVFERFYRGGRAGRRASGEGTGLGLSLVAEHVRLHGGTVWIEDAPGPGTRFVIELPLHDGDLEVRPA